MQQNDRRYHILIVDDEPEVISALRRQLRGWLQEHRLGLYTAASAEEAWQIIERENASIAIMVCDNRMPGTSGVTLIKNAVRKGYQTVPILLTGYTEAHDMQSALSAGVFNLLFKPWEKGQLLEELSFALAAFHGRIRGHDSEGEYRQELRIARHFQDAVLSPGTTVASNGVEIDFSSRVTGAAGVTQDYLDIIDLGAGQFLLTLCTFSLRDLRATAIAGILKHTSRTVVQGECSAAAHVNWLNGQLHELTRLAPDLFVTGTVCRVDSTTGTIHFAAAGAPFPVKVNRDNTSEEFHAIGTALGIKAEITVREEQVTLDEGSSFFLFTGGVASSHHQIFAASVPEEPLESVVLRLRKAPELKVMHEDTTIVRISRGVADGGVAASATADSDA